MEGNGGLSKFLGSPVAAHDAPSVGLETVGRYVCEITSACAGYRVGNEAIKNAMAEEVARAQKEGRKPSNLGALKILFDNIHDTFDVQGAALGWAGAWIEQKRNEWRAGTMSQQVSDWMAAGGLEKLLGNMHALRRFMSITRTMFDSCAKAITDAVFADEGLRAALAGVDGLAEPKDRCEAIRQTLGANPSADKLKAAEAD